MNLGVWRKHHNIRPAIVVQSDDPPNPVSRFQKPRRTTSAVCLGVELLSLALCHAQPCFLRVGRPKDSRRPEGRRTPMDRRRLMLFALSVPAMPSSPSPCPCCPTPSCSSHGATLLITHHFKMLRSTPAPARARSACSGRRHCDLSPGWGTNHQHSRGLLQELKQFCVALYRG